MTTRRWIADEVSGNRAALVGEHARHLSQVLRAKVGQEFDISMGAEVRRGRISSVRPDRIEFELGERIPTAAMPSISIALAIFKFDRMEWALEKCTELGVSLIIPVISARTESHLAAAVAKRTERWRRIAKQASEQSRRALTPEISDPIQLKQLLTTTAEARIVLGEEERELLLRDAVPQGANSLLLAIGPEGGWKPEEIAAFRDAGWTSASLGETILRAETAAIASVAVALSIIQRG